MHLKYQHRVLLYVTVISVSDLLQQWSGVCSDERSDLTSMIVIGFLA